MHGSVVQSGVDLDGAPLFSCQCLQDWTGSEYVRGRAACLACRSLRGRCLSMSPSRLPVSPRSCNTHCRAACNYRGTICEGSADSGSIVVDGRATVKSVVTLSACVCDEG